MHGAIGCVSSGYLARMTASENEMVQIFPLP